VKKKEVALLLQKHYCRLNKIAMPTTAITFFISIIAMLFISEYQSFRSHPAFAGWLNTAPCCALHNKVYTLVATSSSILHFKTIA
jgi:hypothetical protein